MRQVNTSEIKTKRQQQMTKIGTMKSCGIHNKSFSTINARRGNGISQTASMCKYFDEQFLFSSCRITSSIYFLPSIFLFA